MIAERVYSDSKMDWLTDNWGNLASAVGLLVAIVGLALVYLEATEAKNSAKAAEEAAENARKFVRRSLTVGDLQQAIDLVQTIKPLHRDAKWEVVVDRYQQLRSMLADIRARYPSLTLEQGEIIQRAIGQIALVEDKVDVAIRDGTPPLNAGGFNATLNRLQVTLEQLKSDLQMS